MAGEGAWCQFVYTHECRDPVLVTKDIFTFGRSPECDGSFLGCKFMSANHCYIMKDHHGKAWLHDTSTNGTLVNGKRIKSQSVQLCDKDEIKLVYRKDVNCVGFVYLDLKPKEDQEITLENTQEYNDDDNENTPKLTDSQDSTTVTEESDKVQGKRTHCQASSTSGTDSPEAKRQHVDSNADEEAKAPELTKKSSLAENLLCNICQDIFHDCVSLQPCMHSYCAACYSQWMERSKECPSCRLKVSRINRNHLVNNLVDAFLKENPDRKRAQEEIEEMNKKNKITSDMLKPPRRRNDFGSPLFGRDSDSDSVEDLSETSESDNSFHSLSDDDSDEFNPFGGGTLPGTVAGLFGFLSRSLSRSPSQVCRQCPSNGPSATTGVKEDKSTFQDGAASSCGNGTDGGSTTPSTYVCSPAGSHILCLCCLQYMPDRRTDSSAATSVPRQTCCVCNRAFCHLYWGCNGNCNGCLKELKDFTFQDSIDKLIDDNSYESIILKNYLSEKNIPLDDVFKKCIEKLESKEYAAKDMQCTTSSAVLCKKCALGNFQELAYQYRRDIPRDDLPEYVTARDDCYWGRNCRTQRKPHHATRFNHICEQKRFT